MIWQKQGLVYVPDGSLWWAKSYAHLPTAFVMDSCIRVYFAALDENNYGRIAYVDLDKRNPKEILASSSEPVLDIGELGTFDDCGVVPSCVIGVENEIRLYYIGFQRTERVPYMLFTGLAISKDGKHFTKYSRTPILDRTDDEPFSRSAPHILLEDDLWKMWYWTCIQWETAPSGVHYKNVIRYADSRDGIHWQAYPDNCIEPSFPDEYAAGRPCVVKDNTGYKMWYSIRSHSKAYRFGYAESQDGFAWNRSDELAGLSPSVEGWDSEMVSYPSIVRCEGKLLLFYNGNHHGRSGFGYAIWEDEA